jgi:hypothetical protein
MSAPPMPAAKYMTYRLAMSNANAHPRPCRSGEAAEAGTSGAACGWAVANCPSSAYDCSSEPRTERARTSTAARPRSASEQVEGNETASSSIGSFILLASGTEPT